MASGQKKQRILTIKDARWKLEKDGQKTAQDS